MPSLVSLAQCRQSIGLGEHVKRMTLGKTAAPMQLRYPHLLPSVA